MVKYTVRRKTVEDLEETLKVLEDQERIFALEQEIKAKQIGFRERVLKQLDDDVTLDDILKEMQEDGLCRRISVWVTKDH